MIQRTTENNQILHLVKEIAYRMRDPNVVKNSVLAKGNCNRDPKYPAMELHRWSDISLGEGYPGVLLLFAELDQLFPDEKWGDYAHAYVLKIKESIESNGIPSLSLFTGLAGACFALSQASKKNTRYQKLLSKLNAYLIHCVEQDYLCILRANMESQRPSPNFLYEVIQGISGIGLYALSRPSDPPFHDLLQKIVRLLVSLTKPIKIEGKNVPGWYIPSEFFFHEEERVVFPKGNFNLGLSHGITGVLAFMSIAYLMGVVVPGQKEAIERIVLWIKKHRSNYNRAFFWKTVVSFEEEIAGKSLDKAFSGKDAWCYGTPGVANSLFLASKVLNDESLQTYALESFLSIFSRTPEERNLMGPSFCHGISGLLMIVHKMAQATSSSILELHVKNLTKDLLYFYSPNHPFGFKHFESCKHGGCAQIDQVGYLEGSSGILLTLLSLNHSTSNWFYPLCIHEGRKE